jgi:UDP-N-acetylmuramoyl-tripeptide--D-alanyl-D-alanine ligase
MTVEEIRLAARALVVCGARGYEVTGISTDSRAVKAGDLFVALVGDKFDGHDFVDQALSAGACGALYSRDFPIRKEHAQKILMKAGDTLAALGEIAKAYRKGLSATVVAITGSNGKTTTKELARHILEEKLPTVASPASFNNFIGLPLTLFKAESATRVVILEMGTNHPGEIARLADIAAPDVGVITNIGRTHLEGLKSIEGVAAAKGELLHALKRDGVAILNADDPMVMKIRGLAASKVLTFGLSKSSDVYAGAIERVNGGFSFVMNDSVRARLNVPGAHNVYNALAAAAVGRRLGLELAYIAERLAQFKLPAMRLEEKQFKGATVINDAYNANPESMARAIEELAGRKAKRKFFVFADMLELGEQSDELHKELGAHAASAKFDYYWAVGKQARQAVKAIADAGAGAERAKAFDSVEELGRALAAKLKEGDAALVKGSRAMGLEKVFDYLA